VKKSEGGFTLIEVLLSVVVLSLSAAAIADVYTAGLESLDARVVQGQLDSAMSSRMERLLASKYGSLAGGSESITVEGVTYTITWTVDPVDLDGDSIPEIGAKKVTVRIGNKSLVTIVADSAGRITKV